jgi:hypothetical protein
VANVYATWITKSSSAIPSRGRDAASQRKKKEKFWATHEVSLLAKITNAIHVKDFRPIAVLPVIFKLYSRVLYMLGDSMCKPLQAPQLAFRKFHQAHEVSSS